MMETRKHVFGRDVNLTLQQLPHRCFNVVADGNTLMFYTLDEDSEDRWSESERLEYGGPNDPLGTEILAWALILDGYEVTAVPLVQRGWDNEQDRPAVGYPPPYWKTFMCDAAVTIIRPLSSGATTMRTTPV